MSAEIAVRLEPPKPKGDALGDRMKGYESVESDRRAMPGLPFLIRLDGRAFSSFTAGLTRPYDERFAAMMIELTLALVSEANARLGYTQSDEVSLVLIADDLKEQLYFDGRFSKINSCLAGFAAVVFNRALPRLLPEKVDRLPTFDCRSWNVPSLEEAANTILWREIDATKNSVQMLAREHFSHKELHGKGRVDQLDMLHAKGINWNTEPEHFKRGTYVRRETVTAAFTAEEIESLPEKHDARRNPDLVIERSRISAIQLPPLMRLVNPVGVLFKDEPPLTRQL